jgi:hypothetical protein
MCVTCVTDPWAVTAHGFEARDGSYCTEADRLDDHPDDEHPHSWFEHMARKSWVDLEDFATAFFVACSVHRIRLSKADVDLLRDARQSARRTACDTRAPRTFCLPEAPRFPKAAADSSVRFDP